MNPIRVLLVDDHRMFRQGLCSLLEDAQDLTAAGQAGTVAEAIAFLEHDSPDVVLLDVTLPDANGLDAAEAMLRRWPDLRIVLLSIHVIEAYIRKAEVVGARGYLVKDCSPESLVDTVRRVANGERFVSVLGPESRQARIKPAKLTNRQTEVLKRIAAGRKLNEIAKELKISVRTAERHRANIKDSLGIHEAAELIRYAVRNGLVSSDLVDSSPIDSAG